MEKYLVKTAENFQVEVDIPGSKSVANRALIIAAFAEGETLLKNMLFSDDTKYMMEALRKLGNTVIANEENKTVKVSLKFVDQINSIELDSISELHSILSSGTVKGIGLFMDAFFTLRSGGVIIVDDIRY